jgi:3-keto-5-aminohexanoate cleavage enzyme
MDRAPLIITCAVVGAELTREDYPFLPLTPDEIAGSALAAYRAGASIIHLHVRDENGNPTQRVDIFKEVSDRISSECDAILQYSTGGAVGTPVAERYAPLSLKPHMASLSMGSINFGSELFENTEETIRLIAKNISENGSMPELEIFDFGMLESVGRYAAKGILPERYHVNFVLGVPGGMKGTVKNLVYLVNELEDQQAWTVSGIGKCQLPLCVHAIAMGGHVRLGVEDNIYYRKGELARSNAQLIDRIVRIAREMDRHVADPQTARRILGIA